MDFHFDLFKRNKKNIDYKIELYDDDTFKIVMYMDIDESIFTKMLQASLKKLSIPDTISKVPNSFFIDERFLNRLIPAFSPVIRKIERKLKKENKIKKFLVYDILSARYSKENQRLIFKVVVSGIYFKQ